MRANNVGGIISNITVKMKNGTIRKFPHTGKPGGYYTKTVKYENGMVIIEDEYYKKTSIPIVDVDEVIETPVR